MKKKVFFCALAKEIEWKLRHISVSVVNKEGGLFCYSAGPLVGVVARNTWLGWQVKRAVGLVAHRLKLYCYKCQKREKGY
jgi:hypothetical protein